MNDDGSYLLVLVGSCLLSEHCVCRTPLIVHVLVDQLHVRGQLPPLLAAALARLLWQQLGVAQPRLVLVLVDDEWLYHSHKEATVRHLLERRKGIVQKLDSLPCELIWVPVLGSEAAIAE